MTAIFGTEMVHNSVQFVLAPLFLPALEGQTLFKFNLRVHFLIVHGPLAEVETFDVDYQALGQRPNLCLLLHIRFLLTCGTVESLSVGENLSRKILR